MGRSLRGAGAPGHRKRSAACLTSIDLAACLSVCLSIPLSPSLSLSLSLSLSDPSIHLSMYRSIDLCELQQAAHPFLLTRHAQPGGSRVALLVCCYLSNTASFVFYVITRLIQLIEFAAVFAAFEENLC